MRSIIGSDDAAASGMCQKSRLSEGADTHYGAMALTVGHYSLTIFVALNVARAIAYWPQIVSIYRDPGCASAVSLWTWIVFTAANVATVIHALAALGDLIVAAVFGVNAIGCAAIVIFTTYKRCHHRRRFGRTPASTPGLQSLAAAPRLADGAAGIPLREALKHPTSALRA